MRIILHNTSLVSSDYPYQEGYSVICRCLISFHTVGNNNKRKQDEANITRAAGVVYIHACMQTQVKKRRGERARARARGKRDRFN